VKELRKSTKTSVIIVFVQAEIRTEHLPKHKPKALPIHILIGLKKCDVKEWTGFSRLRVGSVEDSCQHVTEISGSIDGLKFHE
jgi:hypothetical protein